MSIKKKQHYVPKRYLKNWMFEKDSQKSRKKGIWVYDKISDKNFFCTDLNSISQARYFYKLDVDENIFNYLNNKYSNKGEAFKFLIKELEALLVINNYTNKKLPNYENLKKINVNYLEDK